MQETLKNIAAEELSFICKVVKKSLEVLNSSWDMTVMGGLMLGLASKGNPGMALYMLSVIDPKPESLITDDDVVREFPMGFVGDWDATWDKFQVDDPDQRAVFRR